MAGNRLIEIKMSKCVIYLYERELAHLLSLNPELWAASIRRGNISAGRQQRKGGKGMPESPRISARLDKEDLVSLLLILEEAKERDPTITLSEIIRAAVKHFVGTWHAKNTLERRCNL